MFCLAPSGVPADEPADISTLRAKALEVLRIAKETSRGIQGKETDYENLAREIAEAQAEAGDINAAMSTVLKNPKYRDLLLSKIVISEANVGEIKSAFETLKGIKTLAERIYAYTGIAIAYSKQGFSVKAEEVFTQALEETELAETRFEKGELLKMIAKSQADIGDVRGAYLTFNKIPDADERARILINMVRKQVEAGNFKLAREIANVIDNGENKSAAFKSLAIGLAKKNRVAEALETSRAIEDNYYKGSALAKISEIQALAGQAAAAKVTFYEAKKISKAIRDDPLEQAMILNDIAQSQWFAGNPADSRESFQEAKQVARSILPRKIEKSLLLKEIALAEWSCGNKDESKQTFQEAKQAALALPVEGRFYHRPIALKALAEALTTTGDLSMADQVVQEAKKAVLSMKGNFQDQGILLTSMADSSLEAGNAQAAVPLLQQAAQISLEISDPEQKAWNLTDIAIYQSKANDLDGALQTLQKAQQAAFRVQDEVQRTAVLMNISISYVRLGFIHAALQIADNSKNENEKAEVLGRITATQVREGDLDDAMKLAGEQNSALFKTKALIGIAKGLLEESAVQRRVLKETAPAPPEEEAGEAPSNTFVSAEGEGY